MKTKFLLLLAVGLGLGVFSQDVNLVPTTDNGQTVAQAAKKVKKVKKAKKVKRTKKTTATKENGNSTKYANQATDELTMAVAWYQTSSEAKALYYQGYQTATNNLKQALTKHSDKKLAVVLDIDETVLDNSPTEGTQIIQHVGYPTGWHDWVLSAQAKAVPGAREFLNYADHNGVDIYYVSDRDANTELSATEENLRNQGLPQANPDHIILKTPSMTSKQTRRDEIEKTHNVVMYVGDNLTDFNDPSESTVDGRNADVEQNKDKFGTQYIILPNPMYGGWESALYAGHGTLTAKDKINLRKQHITYFDYKTKTLKQVKVANIK
ncbi:5'-nucleotidase, lipoprotein e(P4) family [Lentilactobacillus curieae]|uniref:5'-nucleotidase, lipoprotein e(P4) family n=1 Tax=Lentilactobacillus curieae TaxID=1138822 RepID=A0A1S6QHM2_9LACO|nr:5'-nucleotidase, lipoprotein e(P4) family [Lentilactobacillus curieae]AQW21116.1 5'-nucleotidase, lipoprotein e(P4) family [Lentilactobacillus curieae]